MLKTLPYALVASLPLPAEFREEMFDTVQSNTLPAEYGGHLEVVYRAMKSADIYTILTVELYRNGTHIRQYTVMGIDETGKPHEFLTHEEITRLVMSLDTVFIAASKGQYAQLNRLYQVGCMYIPTLRYHAVMQWQLGQAAKALLHTAEFKAWLNADKETLTTYNFPVNVH